MSVLIVLLTFLFSNAPVFSVENNPFPSDEENLPSIKELKTQKNPSEKVISEIIVEGNMLIPTSEILRKMQIDNGDVYSREIVQQGLKNLYRMGYFSDKIKAIPINREDGNITLQIVLEENIPIEDFTIEGNTVISTGEILKILKPLIGKPQNIENINRAINQIEDLYSEEGYILARIVNLQDDPDGVVNLEISEGILNSVSFEGNTKTKDFVVQRNILSQPGTVYNEKLIKQDLIRLYGTQAFKDVTRTIEKVEGTDDRYDVVIHLEEQRTGTVSLGGGIDTVSGLFGTAGFSDNNFRGTGQRLGVNIMVGSGVVNTDSAMVNRANLQAEIDWFEPRLRNKDTSLLVKAFGRDFASYQVPLAIEQRLGMEAVFARPLKIDRRIVSSLSFGLEGIKVKEGNEDEIKKLYTAHDIPLSERARQLKGGLFLTMAPAISFDSRDDALNPRRGVYSSLRWDESVGVDSLRKTFGKLSLSAKKYYPLGKKSSFSLTGRVAGKLHGSNMPEVMAYRLGGPYTVRGFQMSGVGTGEGYMMASAEMRVPIPFVDKIKDGQIKFLNDLRMAFFVDGGKILKQSCSDKIYDRPGSAISAGVGLRIFIPGVGPVSLDWGYPITNNGDKNNFSKGKFTFGVGEFY